MGSVMMIITILHVTGMEAIVVIKIQTKHFAKNANVWIQLAQQLRRRRKRNKNQIGGG